MKLINENKSWFNISLCNFSKTFDSFLVSKIIKKKLC